MDGYFELGFVKLQSDVADQVTDVEHEFILQMLRDNSAAQSASEIDEDEPKEMHARKRKKDESEWNNCSELIMDSPAEIERVWSVAKYVLNALMVS